MNLNSEDCDSNDSDIFVIEHIKPSFQKVLSSSVGESEINLKKGKIRKQSCDLDKKSQKNINQYSSIDGEILNQISETAKGVISKKRRHLLINDSKIFSSKAATSRGKNVESSIKPNFKLHLMESEHLPDTENYRNVSPEKNSFSCKNRENYTLSPSTSKKRHFKINSTSSVKKKKVKTSLFETFNPVRDDFTVKKESKEEIISNTDKSQVKNEMNFENNFLCDEFSNPFLLHEFKTEVDLKAPEEKHIGNSALLCSLFKKIITYEMKKQNDLQELSLKNGIITEKLLLEWECEIYNKFFSLSEKACMVFVRMLGRKKDWHRVSTINYCDISANLETEFEVLKKENFVDTRIEDEDLKIQIALLTKPEVLKLCKDLKISVNSNNKNKKEDLTNSLIENSKIQRSVYDMMKGKNSSNRLEFIKNKISNILGMCVRLNKKVFHTFQKILILFSFAHYFDEEEKRFQNALYLLYQVHKNFIKFPNYKISPTVVFKTLEDFEEYRKALLLQDFFETSIRIKNYNEFVSSYKEAKVEFKKLLKNDQYLRRFSSLEPFLKKFNAGTVYARILTKYCKTFKRNTDNLTIINTMELLLGQNIFLMRKRGEWYEILTKALEIQKQHNVAAEILINGLKDPLINEVQKLTLQLRGQSILKKKTHDIKDVKLREVLDKICTSSVHEPSSIEIKGKALEGIESGFKSVYIQKFHNKTVYSSVEERAILHYKLNGFTKGYHAEGFIVQTLYFFLLFDIIYELSPHGVFQSFYQEAPLDLYSASFYNNRKEAIDLLLSDMLSWNDEQVKCKINDTYRNNGTTCVIKWNDEFTPDLICEIIKCISMPKLILIFQRFLKSFRVSRSGFPDLTLWNPVTRRIKFVEVKSPSDRLSPAQRLWLDYLRNIELECEVCNVKNTSSKI